MKTVNHYHHKKILVLGLAKSGVGAASLLHKLGAFITVNDYKPLDENPEAQSLLQQGITVICGSHPVDLLDEGFEYVVKTLAFHIATLLSKGRLIEGCRLLRK